MKIIILTALMLFFGHLAYAQSIAMEVIGSAGGFDVGLNGSASWTVGEPEISTIQSSTGIATQGFQQVCKTLLVHRVDEIQVLIEVYPNPTITALNIVSAEGWTVSLSDLSGQEILRETLSSAHSRIDLQGPTGRHLFPTGQ